MRVLLVTSLERGGPLEHALSLAGSLPGAGVSVSAVCASRPIAERFRAVGAKPHVIPLSHALDAVNGYRANRAAAGADVVHAQDRRAGLWTRVWPRRRGQARIYTLHGLPDPYLPSEVPGHRPPGMRDRLAYRGIDSFLARRCDAVVVASRFLERELVERLGFPRERIVVIPNGVDEAELPGRTGGLVGTLSVLDPVKGLDVFLRSAGIVRNRLPPTRFAIFGEGRDRKRLQALAREADLTDVVEFPGHVPAAEALSRLSVLALPSWLENCPMSLLEAMNAGVPAVATDVGGVREVTGDTVPLVPPGDSKALAASIIEILSDPNRASANVDSARERVRDRFTAARNAAETASLYAQLLKGRR